MALREGLRFVFAAPIMCLALSGLADLVSTVIRQTLRQRLTPDALGATVSVVSGGIGTVLLAAGVAAAAPVVREYVQPAGPPSA